jgi:RimJ/RimL family protein N-acetyltransferase
MADLEFVLAAEGDPDTAPFILPWTLEQHAAALSDPDLCHRIVVGPTGPVGFVLLAGLAGRHGSIEFRRLVIVDKGRGYGRSAVRSVQHLAFEELQVHRLWLDVKSHNTRARWLYEAEGFVTEGVLRDCLRRADGGYDSLVVMSRLASEFQGA